MKSLRKVLGLATTYELSVTHDYVSSWGVTQAVRELLQNAIDSESEFEVNFTRDSMSIHSRMSGLSPETLLFGSTSKRDDSSKIGSFGEGYKIALLVLTRLGKPVKVWNGNVVWSPEFTQSKQFKGLSKVLAIKELPNRRELQGLTFVVGGLTEDEIYEIKQSCLQLQEVGNTYSTPWGRILLDRKGKLYVNGLFVCETKMRYSYDVKPEYLKLERDRMTVSTFDLQFVTKDMWLETGDVDAIEKMLLEEAPDVSYIQHSYGNKIGIVAKAAYAGFVERHPNAALYSTQAEKEELEKSGIVETVHVPSAVRDLVHTVPEYQARLQSRRTVKDDPSEVLQKFLKKYKGYMQKRAFEAFEELIETSKGWKS